MFRTIAKRRHCRLGLEPLEARELLSGSSSSHAIIGGDATPEAAVSITLHLAGSTAPAGDYVDVASKHVVLTGQTVAGATVVLRKALASGKLRTVAKTHADAQGAYQFKINCGMGTTQLTAQVVEATGVASSTTLSVTRANQAIVWNSIALQAVRTAHLQAPDSSRAFAIVAISVYDAVNAINPKYASYGNVTAKVSKGTSADAAAAAAAETSLAGLFPHSRACSTRNWTPRCRRSPPGAAAISGSRWARRSRTRSSPCGATTAPTRKSTTSRVRGQATGCRLPRLTHRRLTRNGAM